MTEAVAQASFDWKAALTDFSSLLNMEPVGNESKIWMNKSHNLRDGLLKFVSWIEYKLDPSISWKTQKLSKQFL